MAGGEAGPWSRTGFPWGRGQRVPRASLCPSAATCALALAHRGFKGVGMGADSLPPAVFAHEVVGVSSRDSASDHLRLKATSQGHQVETGRTCHRQGVVADRIAMPVLRALTAWARPGKLLKVTKSLSGS